MQTFRIESIVSPKRVLTIRGVPFRAGERVEVIVVRISHAPGTGKRYPLRGKPFSLPLPFDSIAENDWDVLQ